MEPISLLVGALAAGATAGLQDTVSDAVKDAYAGLRRLVAGRFAGKPAAELALAEHEKDPTTWRAPLEKALTESGADQDQQLATAARRLMELLDPSGAEVGMYQVDARGARGVQVGSHNRQINIEQGTYIENDGPGRR